MIYLETGVLYYNVQVHFRKNCWVDMPNDTGAWTERFASWLAEQRCILVQPGAGYVTNGLGVAPGYTKFGFARQEDAATFILRWS